MAAAQVPDTRRQPSMKLSPRFEARLIGGPGGSLLVRALEETRRRAFSHWQREPWLSKEEHWFAAEQSLVRPVMPCLTHEAATQTDWTDHAAQSEPDLKDATLSATLPSPRNSNTKLSSATDCRSSGSGLEIGQSTAVKASDMECELEPILGQELTPPTKDVQQRTIHGLVQNRSQLQVLPGRADAPACTSSAQVPVESSEGAFTEVQSQNGQSMARLGSAVPYAWSGREERRVAEAMSSAEHVASATAKAELNFAVARMWSVQRIERGEVMASPRWTALHGDVRAACQARPEAGSLHWSGSQTDRATGKTGKAAPVPTLPLQKTWRGKGALASDRPGGRFRREGVCWPGFNMELPPLPPPPEDHPLLTPRTGAPGRLPKPAPFVPKLPLALARKATPACKEVFAIDTPHMPGLHQGTVAASPIQSRSPSPSSSEGSQLDLYPDWERVASLETTASGVPQVAMTSRSNGSSRSDFSVCGLYSCGQDAEMQVLRKVIRDLEQQLQAQSKELEALRASCDDQGDTRCGRGF